MTIIANQIKYPGCNYHSCVEFLEVEEKIEWMKMTCPTVRPKSFHFREEVVVVDGFPRNPDRGLHEALSKNNDNVQLGSIKR